MIGNHAIPVLADAILADLPGIDVEEAFAGDEVLAGDEGVFFAGDEEEVLEEDEVEVDAVEDADAEDGDTIEGEVGVDGAAVSCLISKLVSMYRPSTSLMVLGCMSAW